ncbi:hypothetical protein AXP45_23565 [Salmonella enterica subsp. enterica]|uniref:hypothetical protein n=1 Tax=Salmonella enterica TaxID=28901 RepID=UPI001281917F|nr:hypothetical protein [Salmonella enterica]EBQ0453851.1 hypothetical protein [Salmonella enterica subsp. enterica]EDS4118790.1 hypothetical protein [Salmonella enterica subsp. enterica serovar Braenderup]EBQ0471772.1 hypothetical protein [Salmonella enterica subsp. enterica]EBQ0489709.1 hypothetical protein [Salmonella enterica subsp. enterica]EEA7255054.1 hypothetical protein [Salmonella enterica subsp. enterica]
MTQTRRLSPLQCNILILLARLAQCGATRVRTLDLASAASPDVQEIRLLAMKGNLNYETTTNEDVYARSSCASAGSE